MMKPGSAPFTPASQVELLFVPVTMFRHRSVIAGVVVVLALWLTGLDVLADGARPGPVDLGPLAPAAGSMNWRLGEAQLAPGGVAVWVDAHN